MGNLIKILFNNYIFHLYFNKLNKLIILGFLTFGIRELTVETTSEPKDCEQNLSATCLDAYLAEFVRELTAPIRVLQNRAVEDQKSLAESEGGGGSGGQSARDRSESTATQRPTTPVPSRAPERFPLGHDNSDVLCQSGMELKREYIITLYSILTRSNAQFQCKVQTLTLLSF